MTELPSLLILSFSPIRSDPRVLKQVELFKEKYRVSTCAYGPAPDGVDEHFALPAESRGWPSDKVGLIARQYSKVYNGLSAVRSARGLLPKGRFDIIVANDLNTLPLALELDPRFGVHSDLHEFAPREKDDNLKWRLFVAPFMRWLCSKYLGRAESVTTVSRGIADEYFKDYGIQTQVVTNAAPYAHKSVKPVGEKIRLIHSAAGQRYRKLETFVEAMRDAPEWLSLDMIVMPNEPDYVAELKQLAAGVPSIRFRDPVPYNQLVAVLNEYDVSVVFLPPTNFNLKNALPNKFFEAVQARIGLIVGPSPAMVDLVKQHQLGAITSAFTAASLRETLHALTPEAIGEWKNAADLAANSLSSEEQVRVWDDAIQRIAAKS